MQRRAWIWACSVAVLTVICVWQFLGGSRVETDLLAMLPSTERNPVAERAALRLSRFIGDRVVFLVNSRNLVRAEAAAVQLAESLGKSTVFKNLHAVFPPIDVGEVARFYTPYRFRLLALSDRVESNAQSIRTQLATRLMSPVPTLPGVGLSTDPLGHLAKFISALPFRGLRLDQEHGFFIARDHDGVHVLVTGDLVGSSYDPKVQEKALASVAGAEKSLLHLFPDVSLLRTGTVFFSGESRSSAEREMNLIGWGSLFGIAVLLFLVFRSPRHIVFGQICVATGILTGTVVSIAVFGRLYLLTLVCGSSLIGVAEDYPLQFFAQHLAEGGKWEPSQGLRRIAIGLLLGFVTTLLGYASLLITPFPGLQQIAVFSVSGLTASFLTVFLLFPAAMILPLSSSAFPLRWAQRCLSVWQSRTMGRIVPWVMIALALLTISALFPLKFHDDIRKLVNPASSLLKQESEIRRIIGVSNSSQFFLVRGNDEGQVLEREEALRKRLAPLIKRGDLSLVLAVSDFVPSPRRQRDTLRRFSLVARDLLPRALRQEGFRNEVLRRLQRDLSSSRRRPLTVASWMRTSFATPFRYLWIGPTKQGYASIVLPLGIPSRVSVAKAAYGLDGIAFVDQVQSLSRAFGRYRVHAAIALAGAFLFVFFIISYRYGCRRGAFLLVPVAFAIPCALAVTFWTGNVLTFFNVIAVILVLGIGVDYSIFLEEALGDKAPAFLGVVLAAITTLLSFGFLSLSAMPALQSFGITLVVGVLVSLLLAPLVVTFGKGRRVE